MAIGTEPDRFLEERDSGIEHTRSDDGAGADARTFQYGNAALEIGGGIIGLSGTKRGARAQEIALREKDRTTAGAIRRDGPSEHLPRAGRIGLENRGGAGEVEMRPYQ